MFVKRKSHYPCHFALGLTIPYADVNSNQYNDLRRHSLGRTTYTSRLAALVWIKAIVKSIFDEGHFIIVAIERRMRIPVGGHCEDSVFRLSFSSSLLPCVAILALIFRDPSSFSLTLYIT